MSTATLDIRLASVPGQQTVFGQPFPLVYVGESSDADLDAVTRWVKTNGERLIDEAAEHGAILFRGLPIETDQDFDAFVTAFNLPNFAYKDSLSNAVRVNRTQRVFTANEAPPDVTIYLHHEMAQTPIYPSRLFFFCEKAAEQGGQTPLCRSDLLYERLLEQRPEFARICETKGLRYSNVMPPDNDANSGMGRSWRSTLGVADRDAAEQRLRSLGYTWQWLPDGCLRATTPTLPAVRDLGNGRRSFFNQLIAAYCGWKDARNDPSKSITFGDGSALNADDVQTAVRLAEELTFDVPWQQGDVALVDNRVAMHGRRAFDGTRKVLASLVAS